MINQIEMQSSPINLYQIDSSISSQKSQTYVDHNSGNQDQFENQDNFENLKTYMDAIQHPKVSEPISNSLKEQINSYIYKNNIHQQDYILIICTFFLIMNNSSQQSTFQRFSLVSISLLKILESVFQPNNDVVILNIIKQNKSQVYSQQQLQSLADLWFLINKFSQDGEDIINYYDAFNFFEFVLKKHFSKFEAFLMFLVKKSQIKKVRITSGIYYQIISFFFSYQTNEYHKYLWNESPLIQEFLNQEKQKNCQQST